MEFIDAHFIDNEFTDTRQQTLNLVSTLEPEDFVPQAAEFTSPPRWHLAHATWLFEILLQKYLPGYQTFDDAYLYQFNSYYERFGNRIPRPKRGHQSRPTVKDILVYRSTIETRVRDFLASKFATNEALQEFKIGIEHEKQHQELLVWDLKFHLNDSFRVPFKSNHAFRTTSTPKQEEIYFEEGLTEIGFRGNQFSWDNERPVHKQYIHGYTLDKYPVTNGNYLEFVERGCYEKPEYWLSDGWKYLQTNRISAPQYWEENDGNWHVRDYFGLHRIVDRDFEPVSHISYYEADAYARWKKKRLPSEAEREKASQKTCATNSTTHFAASQNTSLGVFLDDGLWRPSLGHEALRNPFFFGLWEWTTSDYQPFPGFQSDFAEYNDKWFINPKVLRGGSFATWRNHYRISYRNFFYPHDRWVGTGFRCARTVLQGNTL